MCICVCLGVLPSHLGVLQFAVSANARSIILGLLEKDPLERLGVRGDGVDEILSHPFFGHIDWRKLYQRQIPPPCRPKMDAGVYVHTPQLISRYVPKQILTCAQTNSSVDAEASNFDKEITRMSA